jgi:hypothetical protein
MTQIVREEEMQTRFQGSLLEEFILFAQISTKNVTLMTTAKRGGVVN